MTCYYNVHAHLLSSHSEDKVILNILIRDSFIDEKEEARYRSYGIHPWFPENIDVQMEVLATCLAKPEAVAVGEVGLDKTTEVDMALQTAIFHTQALLAEKMNKPLIIHCVKAWQELLKVRKEIEPDIPWIIHGFRGNHVLADQLLRQGCYLSFGKKFNPGALAKAWPDRLLVETDIVATDIREIYAEQADNLSLSLDTFAAQIEKNSKRIFICFK